MRNLNILIATVVLFVLASCNKTLKVDSVSLSVNTASTSYNAGDSVNFMFTGQPDMITFYSGETGHNYLYRNRTTSVGNVQLQFASYAQYGTQDSTLHLLVSTNFNGSYDSADIYQATWTDVTNQATLSTGSNNTPSGIIDLSADTVANKPIYFAFKYVGDTGSTQKTWIITNFQINLLLADSSTTSISNISNAGWKAVNIKNSAAVWKITSTQVSIAGGNDMTNANEDWLITSPLTTNNVLPDQGIAIKNITQKLFQFSYIYKKPGSYNAYFVGTNATADGVKSLVKTVGLTIN